MSSIATLSTGKTIYISDVYEMAKFAIFSVPKLPAGVTVKSGLVELDQNDKKIQRLLTIAAKIRINRILSERAERVADMYDGGSIDFYD